MYRQNLVIPFPWSLQKSVWYSSMDVVMKIFELYTVTCGTVYFPFQWILWRILPKKKESISLKQQHLYVQINTWTIFCRVQVSYEMLKSQELNSQLIYILQRGGLEVHKFVSNHSELLKDTGSYLRTHIWQTFPTIYL